MLRFFKFGSVVAACGLVTAVTLGGCGPATGASCSTDLHSVVDSSGKVAASCKVGEACVVDGSSSGCALCDATQCLKGDDCVTGYSDYDTAIKADTTTQTTACRLTCNAQSDCPFDYHCIAGGNTTDKGAVNYCVPDRVPGFLGSPFKPTTPGEGAAGAPWGVACDPTKGLDTNSDCDTSQSFWCYGTSPTDANSYCTQFQCTDDGDCPGGWWCGTVNDSPNVTGPCAGGTSIAAGNCKAVRNDWGTTISVCMPRAYDTKPGSYCAPCSSDVDCPLNDGAAQHCVSADGASAKETVCATECQSDANCPFDQACTDTGLSSKVCLPRAATCKGDGSFCSPCHSDTDCAADANAVGYCIQADYSTEHFCTAPTPTCTYDTTNGYKDSCPALPDAAKPPNSTTDGVGCSYNTQAGIPLDQCYAANVFGLGCYTYHCSGTGGSCYGNSDCCSNKCDTNAQMCN